MKTYMLFGIRGTDLPAARGVIEGLLGIQLRPHESGYHCGDYFRSGDVGEEHWILQKNFDDSDGEWTEPSFPEYGLLLYVNEASRASEIEAALAPVAAMLTKEEV